MAIQPLLTFLWNSAISKLGVGKTALFGTLIPLLSSIEAVFVLNETFTLFQAISGLIILSGIVINTWPSKSAWIIRSYYYALLHL